MGDDRKFYKYVYMYEVLSEEQLPDCLSLTAIHEMTDTGDCVGRFGEVKEVVLTPKETADALYEFGSEPGFFMLDDDGLEVED